jgi:hypothetical protein
VDPAAGTRTFAHGQLAAGVLERCASCHGAVQPMDAVHERPSPCGACHGTDAWTPATFTHDAADGSLAARCAACHRSDIPRDDRLHEPGMAACADCHDTRRWTPAHFEHRRFFVLDRDHDVRCATCHDRRGDFGAYTCYGCHEHSPAGMRQEHAEEGPVRDLDRCARCHRSAEDDGGEHERRGD